MFVGSSLTSTVLVLAMSTTVPAFDRKGRSWVIASRETTFSMVRLMISLLPLPGPPARRSDCIGIFA